MLCTKKNHIFDRLKNTVQSTVFFSPRVRRHKGFPKENLGAGGIHFRRAGEMKRAPENRKIFGNNGSDAGEVQRSVNAFGTNKRPNQNKKPVLTEDGFFSPQVRRHKSFPEENLGAGGIHFRRASEMKRAPENRKIFGNCGVTQDA